MKWTESKLHRGHLMTLCIFALVLFVPRGRAQAPVFEIVPAQSWIKFHVKSSATIAGKFDKWDAGLMFRTPDETTGVLEIKIEAASVDTGSGLKNGKLKSKDFFDVEQNPYITFKGLKPRKMTLVISGKGTGSGEIHGAMNFNRKDYGMDKGIPLSRLQTM